jgi:hypothetical protein
MDERTVSIELPQRLYQDLEFLAAEDQTDPVEVIARLVALACERQAWRRNLTELREEIRRHGGLSVGTTKEQVVERLRQTRRQIFEAEYAHLYR